MNYRTRVGISCNTCKVNFLCLGKDLNAETLEQLDNTIEHVKVYQPGEHFYFENDKVNEIFAIYSGVAKDYLIDKEGNEYIKEFYIPGDILGLEFLNLGYFKLNAVAILKTTVCVIPVSKLINEKNHISNHMQRRFFEILCQKIDNSNNFHLMMNAKNRVASFYLNIIKREKERNPSVKKITVPISHLDISNKLGIANETLSRVLHFFIDENLIKFEKNTIVDVDLHGLKKITHSF